MTNRCCDSIMHDSLVGHVKSFFVLLYVFFLNFCFLIFRGKLLPEEIAVNNFFVKKLPWHKS